MCSKKNMEGRVIALIVGAIVLLSAGLSMTIVGVLPLAGVSVFQSSLASFDDVAANAMKEANDVVNQTTDNIEGVFIALVVLGLLSIGGGTTCAVFAHKFSKK